MSLPANDLEIRKMVLRDLEGGGFWETITQIRVLEKIGQLIFYRRRSAQNMPAFIFVAEGSYIEQTCGTKMSNWQNNILGAFVGAAGAIRDALEKRAPPIAALGYGLPTMIEFGNGTRHWATTVHATSPEHQAVLENFVATHPGVFGVAFLPYVAGYKTDGE